LALVLTILASTIAFASILFAAIGFLFSAYATVSMTYHTVVQDPIENPLPAVLGRLHKGARRMEWGIVLSALLTIGCLVWFAYPEMWIQIVLATGLVFEVLFLVVTGRWIVNTLMQE
jgi:cobalamin synthase